MHSSDDKFVLLFFLFFFCYFCLKAGACRSRDLGGGEKAELTRLQYSTRFPSHDQRGGKQVNSCYARGEP